MPTSMTISAAGYLRLSAVRLARVLVMDSCLRTSPLASNTHTACLRFDAPITRAKDNMKYRAVKNHPTKSENILKDQTIALQGKHKGMKLRRVEAWVEVDGKWRTMVFITNNTEWSPRSVCDLYQRRWDIEVFFKQVKQSLKLGSFLGHSANAVRWQVYTALLVYVLLRYMAHLSTWGHSFTRLFAVTRSALWERIDLMALLKSYGTASGRFKVIGALNTAWLPGFAPAKT
jgi:hypothetical protein